MRGQSQAEEQVSSCRSCRLSRSTLVGERSAKRARSVSKPVAVEQAQRFVELDFRLKDAEKTLQDRIGELGETQEKWERETVEQAPKKSSPPRSGELLLEGKRLWRAAQPLSSGP